MPIDATIRNVQLVTKRSDEEDVFALVNEIRAKLNALGVYHAFATTTDGVAKVAWESALSLDTDAAWLVSVRVVGFCPTDGVYAAYSYEYRAVTFGGALAVDGTPLRFDLRESVAGWNSYLTATGNTLQVAVLGDAARTVEWTVRVEMLEATD